MPDPAVGVGTLGRALKEGLQVGRGLVVFPPFEQEEGHAVMGSDKAVVQLEGALVVPDGFVGLAGLGEGDGDVLQDPGVIGMIPERQPIGGERRGIIALALEGERFIEIVEPLRAQAFGLLVAKQAAPKSPFL